MKNALLQKPTWTKTSWAPMPVNDSLVRIRIKDYSLLAIRDFSTELSVNDQLEKIQNYSKDFNTTNLKRPRFYTIVSQNRKISPNEKLSQTSRLFLNYESFKWSELYFQFFRKITDIQTNRFVFKNILYTLDFLMGHYLTMCLQTSPRKAQVGISSAVHRQKALSRFIMMLLVNEFRDSLIIFFLYDLTLKAIGQSKRSNCADLINSSEAQLMLNHFRAKGLFEIVSGALKINLTKTEMALRDFLSKNGKMLIYEFDGKQNDENFLTKTQNLFQNTELAFENELFQASFTHD